MRCVTGGHGGARMAPGGGEPQHNALDGWQPCRHQSACGTRYSQSAHLSVCMERREGWVMQQSVAPCCSTQQPHCGFPRRVFHCQGVRLPKDAGTGGKVVWVEVEDLSRIPTPSSGAAVRPRGHLTWPPDVAGGEPIVPPLPSLQLTSMPMTCTAPLVIHTEEGLVAASKGFSRCTAGKAEQLMDRHCREPCMH